MVGNLVSVTPTRKTASHSRPLARCTVSSLTESASDGVATSRPWPNSSSASSQARSAASVTCPSTAWNSETAWTNRSRFSRRAAAAGLTDDASSTSMPVVSMIRRTRSRIGSPMAPRRRRSSAASRANRSRASAGVVEVAGIVEGVAQRRDLGGIGPLDGCEQLGVHVVVRRSPALAPGEVASAPPEQREVARTDRPARAGQQGEQRGVGRDVLDQVERRDHLRDLRQPEQALETDDLDRDLPVAQRVEDRRGVGVVAGEHADLAPAGLLGARGDGRHGWPAPGRPAISSSSS